MFLSKKAIRALLAGIELMHMIRKSQLIVSEGENMSFANQFYSLEG